MMTSRERLLCTLRGELPDRVPVSCYELVGYDTHNFCNREPSYHSLMEYIREKTDCMAMWNPGSNLKFVQSSYDPHAEYERTETSDGYIVKTSLRTGSGTLTSQIRRINGIYTTWQTEHLCKDSDDIEQLMSLPFEAARFDASDAPRILNELGDHGILMPSLEDAAYSVMSLMEFGESMVYVLTEEDHFAEMTKEMHRRIMINLKEMLETTPGDMYRICGPEYLCPPYLPPRFFEKYMTPYLSDMVDLIHSYGRLVRVHCHGKIGKVIDMIVETGCDGIDPCEEIPDGDTTLEELKARVGDKICLFGSMQLKQLEACSREDVVRETKRMMLAGKPGGRFVIMPTAAPIDVPLKDKTRENYMAYIDTALEYASY